MYKELSRSCMLLSALAFGTPSRATGYRVNALLTSTVSTSRLDRVHVDDTGTDAVRTWGYSLLGIHGGGWLEIEEEGRKREQEVICPREAESYVKVWMKPGDEYFVQQVQVSLDRLVAFGPAEPRPPHT